MVSHTVAKNRLVVLGDWWITRFIVEWQNKRIFFNAVNDAVVNQLQLLVLSLPPSSLSLSLSRYFSPSLSVYILNRILSYSDQSYFQLYQRVALELSSHRESVKHMMVALHCLSFCVLFNEYVFFVCLFFNEFTGRQCLCTGERDWIRAVSSQWALLWLGQCTCKNLKYTDTLVSIILSFVSFLLPFTYWIPCLWSFQFGNTCYCNSVLQALYFCRPFREKILAYRSQPRRKENLLTCLADLFHSIANQKRKVGVIPPKKFITRLRKENG